MRDKTKLLLSSIRKEQTLSDKTAVLLDSFKGETAYIISCGPSLNVVLTEEMKRFLADKLVLTIKRAGIELPSDFYFMNFARMAAYKLPDPNTIRVGSSDWSIISSSKEQFCQLVETGVDLFYLVHCDGFDKSLAVSKKWESALLTNKDYMNKRPWGPGIILDIALWLALHLGVSRVIIFGWDMKVEGKYTHYFNMKSDFSGKEGIDREAKAIPAAMTSLRSFCAGRGVELLLCSPLSSLPLPQISAQNIMNGK